MQVTEDPFHSNMISLRVRWKKTTPLSLTSWSFCSRVLFMVILHQVFLQTRKSWSSLVILSYPSLCRPMRKTVLLPPNIPESVPEGPSQVHETPISSRPQRDWKPPSRFMYYSAGKPFSCSNVFNVPISHHQLWYCLNLPGSGYLLLIHPVQWCYLSHHQCCFTTTNPHPHLQPSFEQLLQYRCHICLQQDQCLHSTRAIGLLNVLLKETLWTVNFQSIVSWYYDFELFRWAILLLSFDYTSWSPHWWQVSYLRGLAISRDHWLVQVLKTLACMQQSSEQIGYNKD